MTGAFHICSAFTMYSFSNTQTYGLHCSSVAFGNRSLSRFSLRENTVVHFRLQCFAFCRQNASTVYLSMYMLFYDVLYYLVQASSATAYLYYHISFTLSTLFLSFFYFFLFCWVHSYIFYIYYLFNTAYCIQKKRWLLSAHLPNLCL